MRTNHSASSVRVYDTYSPVRPALPEHSPPSSTLLTPYLTDPCSRRGPTIRPARTFNTRPGILALPPRSHNAFSAPYIVSVRSRRRSLARRHLFGRYQLLCVIVATASASHPHRLPVLGYTDTLDTKCSVPADRFLTHRARELQRRHYPHVSITASQLRPAKRRQIAIPIALQ